MPVAGAEFEPATVSRLSSCSAVVPLGLIFGAASFMGGGRFLPAAAAPGAGASRVGAGSGCGGGWDFETSSWRALKLRFLRIGAAGAGVAMASGGLSRGCTTRKVRVRQAAQGLKKPLDSREMRVRLTTLGREARTQRER